MGNQITLWFRKLKIRRTSVLLLLFFVMSFILVQELFQLQIIEGQNFISTFQSRTTKNRVIKSARGKIYDGKGNLLARNILSYSLTLEDNGSYDSLRVKNLALNSIAYRVIKILDKNGDSLSNSFHIIVDENGQYAFDVSPGFTLSRFKADIYGQALIDNLTKEEADATAQEMIDYLTGPERFCIILEGEEAYTPEELASVGLPEKFSPEDLLRIAIIRYQLSTNSFKRYMPVTIATHVSEESVAAIMENQATLTGVEVVEDSTREYLSDISMGPVLGYIGQASAEELADLRKQNPDYANDAVIGKAGLEQSFELTLQGTNGEETLTVDNLGKVLKIDETTQVDPIAGNDIYLTIDPDWQSAIYEILKQRVAGILLSKITAEKTFNYENIIDAAQIEIPIYDIYYALIDNSIVDIREFEREDASEVEKNLNRKFQKKQKEVFELIRNRLTGFNLPAYKDETVEVQAYLSYICDDYLTNTVKVISADSVDTGDETYLAFNKTETISLKDYLTYAASQNWLDISVLSPEGTYLDSQEVYQALTDFIVEDLKTDYGFSKLLYKYMLLDETVLGTEIEECLYEQGVLTKEDDELYDSLISGAIGGYDFIVSKIASLEIEPSDLALMPCSASAVVVDVNSGRVLACVSYPGYENNRLGNSRDTDYFAKLALDQSSPFFNRATQQRTAPGSTMKLLSTITGMQEGVINDDYYVDCTGSFDLIEPPINCWNIYGHGSIEIREAIQESCNYYFNMVGFLLGKVGNRFSESQSLGALQKYASQMGLDKKTGIEIIEAAPQVSNALAVPSYMGQGTHLYTTTQLARYVSVVANRGTVYDLTLLDKVTDPEGNVIELNEPKIINQLNVPDNVWEDLHDGMKRVVETHRQFDNVQFDVSGKTGTAELDLYHPNHGLFVGFAPSYDPKYAIAVRIANGYSSGNACLIAADIIQYIFELVDPAYIITGFASDDVSDVSND